LLPFTSIEFYILFGIIILAVHLLKPLYSRFISYDNLLMGIVSFFILFFFNYTYQIIGFAIFSYCIYYLYCFRFPKVNRLYPALILAIPMVLLKVKFNIHWLGFAGMSYITFRTIQIVLDTQPTEQRISFKNYFLFLTFIPTLLIGPIDRSQRFIKNLEEGYQNLNFNLFFEGWQNVVLGVFQKYVLAELVSQYWLPPAENVHGFLNHTNAAFAYTAYLYFDFAGYSSLAVGFGRMLGIKVPANFNQPYLAINPQDFWRRWHITLGDWLRDYFFRPIYKWLSGFKALKNYPLAKQNVSLFLTFALMGCWNGFERNYILSGFVFGCYSVIHNSYTVECKRRDKDVLFENWNPMVTKYFSIIAMLLAAVFAIYLFSGRAGL